MLDLKNEALRERHWREILPDITINNLTLENLFQMNLHEHYETIQSNGINPMHFFDILSIQVSCKQR